MFDPRLICFRLSSFMDVAILEKEALLLPEHARAILADRLIESISPPPSNLLDAWIAESESRLDAFQRGEIEVVDGQEALKALRNSLSK